MLGSTLGMLFVDFRRSGRSTGLLVCTAKTGSEYLICLNPFGDVYSGATIEREEPSAGYEPN